MDTFFANRLVLKLTAILLGVLSLFVAAKFIGELQQWSYAGDKYPPQNTISVSGHGEVFAVPDIAEITFDVSAIAKDVPTAQKQVTDKMNAIIDALKKAGIAENDIKTVGYNIYPQYEYQPTTATVCPMGSYCPPVPGKQVLTGYEVRHSIDLKVRKTDQAGTILSNLGTMGVTNLGGINFTIDDQEKVKDDAREKAITDAKAKAQVLAAQLGVRIVRVVSFQESGNYPIYYAKAMSAGADGRGAGYAEATPSIPTGENQITSDVTITYEVR